MADRIRVAVIGTSFASSVQIPGFQLLDGVEVVGVASARESRAKDAAERFVIPAAYGDWRRMLDEVECDVVSIVTPPHLHHEMALAALDRGRHVICEKPFAMDVAQGREMVDRAVASGLVHAVDHEFRYMAARRYVKELLEAGYVGEPRVARWAWLMPMLATPQSRGWDWWSERSKGGGLFGALGSHLIDSLMWWLGDITEVTAQINTFVEQRQEAETKVWRAVSADDDVSMLLRFKNGARASVDLTGLARVGHRKLEIFGSEGTLVMEEDARVLGSKGSAPLAELTIPEHLITRVEGDQRVAPFTVFARRVMARVRGGDEGDFADFRQGLRVQRVMDAAHASMDDRTVVAVLGDA
ncbi:MAG: Gfo/Idh/MocA family oxidoreductase [Chloroflexota bacterium]